MFVVVARPIPWFSMDRPKTCKEMEALHVDPCVWWENAFFHTVEVLAWSCTDPSEKILWRSGWNLLRVPCMILHGSLFQDLVRILVTSFLRGLWQVLVRRSCGDPSSYDPAQILICMRRFYGHPREVLSTRSLHDLAQVLVRPLNEVLAWSCAGPSGEVLPQRSLHDLVQVLTGRSCEDRAEIILAVPAWSCTTPSEKILWRSWRNPP